jgi:hypothetical protein
MHVQEALEHSGGDVMERCPLMVLRKGGLRYVVKGQCIVAGALLSTVPGGLGCLL